MGDIYNLTKQNQVATRTSTLKLNQPLRKSNYGQKCISFLGPSVWNSLPDNLRQLKNTNTFKHKIKELYFQKLKREDTNMYVY